MKRFNFLLATLLAIVFSNGAKADVVTNYKVDFNTTISTSAHDFKVAPGWGHVVSYYEPFYSYDKYYVEYTYQPTGGITEGCLKVGTQTSVGEGYETGSTTDLLVTPKITGASSIYVKKVKSSGTVKFYKVTKSSGKYTKGSQITVALPTLSTDEFVKVEIPVQTDTYIGIYGTDVYLDDFEAASADIQLKELTISKVKLTSAETAYCTPEGKFTVSMDVTVKNTGAVDLHVGDENYSLSIYNNSKSVAVYTQNITEDMTVGAEKTISLSTEINYSDYPSRNRYDAKENITNATVYCAWIEPIAYKPDPVFKNEGNTTLTSGNCAQSFGMILADAEEKYKTKSFKLTNKGAAPLVIEDVVVPEGFTTSMNDELAGGISIAAEETKEWTLKFIATTPNAYSGQVKIVMKDIADPFVMDVSGTILDPKKYFLNFEDRKMPAGALYESDYWKVTTNTNGSNNYAQSERSDLFKLITPKLKVSADETMTFEVAKRQSYSKMNVYYSTDRENWTPALALTSSDFPSSTGTFKQFTLSGVPAGEYYIAFESGYCYLDNVYGFELVDVAHDAMVSAQELPVTGMVNYEYKASATLKNIHKEAEAAGGYTATLYVNSEAVATATSVDIAAAGSAAFDFAYTPHAAGTFETYIEFAFTDGYKVQSEKVNVTISEENGDKVATVGTKSDTGLYLLNGGYKLNESETIYTVEKLGFTDNKTLTGVLFKGTKTSDDQVKHIKVYLQNTEDATPTMTTGVELPVESMTLVYEGDYTLKKGETDLLDLTFTTPFSYQKDMNLRMVIQGSSDNKVWQTYYEVEKADQTHFKYRNHDTDLSLATPYSTYLPVANFTIEVLPATVSGIVTTVDGTSPLANAEVTLTSDNVIYRATTDAEGKYKATVYQVEKTYSATMKKDAVEKTKTDITFAPDQTTEVNFILDGTVTFKKGQASTLILATAPDAAKGDYYELSAVSGNQVVFTKVETPQANTPYVFMAKDDYTTETISVPTIEAGAKTIGDVTFQGIYDYKNLVSDETTTYYGFRASDGTFVKVGKTKGAVIYPMHAYIKVSGSESSKELRFFFEDNEATTIVGTLVDAEDKAELYDLNGRRVSKNQAKGVVVKNGKKLNVKNLKK
ncbi:MAG: carboxypeptidase regulatory-like domain-containing protein [Prevotella sp.]